MSKGYLAIVFHAHLPFVRHPEHQDSLEENWFYEALTEVYLPLLLVLESLVEDGVDFRLTFSFTPTLLSMLLDPLLQSRYLRRLERLIELAEKEIERTAQAPEFQRLARLYHQRFLDLRNAFADRYGSNLVEAFRRFQALGKIELLGSAATHAYLPLLSVNPSAVRAQVQTGIAYGEQVLGRRPEGFWLPECGYSPEVGQTLSDEGIRFTILETHGLTRAEPRPKWGVYAPIYSPSGLAAFGRDPESSRQVWSSAEGYPGDYDYREFYRDIAYDLEMDYLRPYIHPDGIRLDTGIKYYRVTGKTNHKEPYDPVRAENKARIHADNFIFNRQKQVEYLASVMDRTPLIVAPYDAELFGHWWYEGPAWVNHVVRKIASGPGTLRLITLSEYLGEYPINQTAAPAISSWGYEGFNDVWLNRSNDWIYPHLHRAARLMEKLSDGHRRPGLLAARALAQAKRELFLAQASDWAFMINSGAMTEYATRRTERHLSRFFRLGEQIQNNTIDESVLRDWEAQDNIFSSLL
ncbi:MAG: 1,4-alpha-glucan branching protein domain-containing protein [Terriglobia bacterium]|jgi:1,4-alpha-glucan branching enzyme